MIPEDITYLHCIECDDAVELKVFEEDKKECSSGLIFCKKCDKKWPVINGIPRILPDSLMKSLIFPKYRDFFEKYDIKLFDEKEADDQLKSATAQSFSFEWLKYPQILVQFEKDWQRYFNPFIYREDIKNQVVADFGCGMAKHGYFVGKYGAKKYIGLDLSEAAEAAYRNTKEFAPLIVQADIYNPPLNGALINIFYSIGVLHHLPDPEGGFKKIVSLMKKNAKILIWVYGKRRNARAMLLYNPLRVVTTNLPPKLLYKLCYVPALAVHLINLGYKMLKSVGLNGVANLLPFSYYADFPYAFKVSDSFDVLGTPKQVYYELDDIKDWFKNAGVHNAKFEYDLVQGIKGFGVK